VSFARKGFLEEREEGTSEGLTREKKDDGAAGAGFVPNAVGF